MKITGTLSILLITGVLTQSCVSKKEYTALQTSQSRLQSNYDRLQESNSELDKKYQISQQQFSASGVRVKSLDEQLASEKLNLAAL